MYKHKVCPLCEDGKIFDTTKCYDCTFCHGKGVISMSKYMQYVRDHKSMYNLYGPEEREQVRAMIKITNGGHY